MIQHCNYQEFLLYQAQSYEKRFKQVRGKQRASSRELKAKKKEIDKLKKRIEELEDSTSYRVGRAITYVPGKIKNLGKKKRVNRYE